MDTWRVTKGTFVGTGVKFVEIDDYSDPLPAHKILANALVGATEIHEKQVDEQEKQFDERETQHIIELEDPAGGQIEDKSITKRHNT